MDRRGGVSHEKSPRGESGGQETRPDTVGRSLGRQSVSHCDPSDRSSGHWDADLSPRTYQIALPDETASDHPTTSSGPRGPSPM